MILRHVVTVQQHTDVVSDIGIPVPTFSTFATLAADVQPASLSPAIQKLFGLSDLVSDSKFVFFRKNTAILVGMRVMFESKPYEIRGLNTWNIHTIALCNPVEV
jgi:hypothetical protein